MGVGVVFLCLTKLEKNIIIIKKMAHIVAQTKENLMSFLKKIVETLYMGCALL